MRDVTFWWTYNETDDSPLDQDPWELTVRYGAGESYFSDVEMWLGKESSEKHYWVEIEVANEATLAQDPNIARGTLTLQ